MFSYWIFSFSFLFHAKFWPRSNDSIIDFRRSHTLHRNAVFFLLLFASQAQIMWIEAQAKMVENWNDFRRWEDNRSKRKNSQREKESHMRKKKSKCTQFLVILSFLHRFHRPAYTWISRPYQCQRINDISFKCICIGVCVN